MSPSLALSLSLLLVLGSWVEPVISIYLSLGLVAILMLQARVDYIPSLAAIQIGRADFFLIGEAFSEFSYSAKQAALGTVMIGGFPVGVSMFIALLVPVALFVDMLRSESRLRSPSILLLLGLWLCGLIFSGVASLKGYEVGNPSWSVPVRCMLYGGLFFYGISLARTWRSGRIAFARQSILLMALLLPLGAFGIFFNRLLFVFAAACVPMALWSLKFHRNNFYRVLSYIIMISGLIYSLGFTRSVIDIEGGLLGTSGSTFTLNALFATSALVAGFSLLGARRLARHMKNAAPLIYLFLAVATLAIALGDGGDRIGMGSYSFRVSLGDLTLVDRIKAKLYDDRSPIWKGALQDIMAEPVLLKPSGRTFPVEFPDFGVVEWKDGAHNTYLEQLRQSGPIGGLILLLLVGICVQKCGHCVSGEDKLLASLAATTLTSLTVGSFTGHYVLVEGVAVWIVSVGGLCWALAGVRIPRESSYATCRSDSVSKVQGSH
jgi:hypothetical protein